MGISIEDMNKIKRAMLFIFIFGMNTLSLFADNGGRGRLDNDGPSDFAVVLFAIFAIVVGGFLAFIFLGGSAQDDFKDKEMNKTGCLFTVAVIMGIVLLIGMCSH